MLQSTICPGDIASRFDGNEFAEFMPCTSEETIARVKEELSRRLMYTFQMVTGSFTVSASIGDPLPHTLEITLQQANAAMYQAKGAFKANGNSI